MGDFEKVLELTRRQIEELSIRMDPEETQLWNARQVQIEALIELDRMEEARAAITEIRELVDLEQSRGRRRRIDRLAALAGME
jgi:hypothetical protein